MREKLIELIRHEVVPYFAERIADHLIANGVTVRQKGEPVKRVVMQLCNSDGEVVEEYYGYCCPFCDEEAVGDFCPACGADMRGEEHEID